MFKCVVRHPYYNIEQSEFSFLNKEWILLQDNEIFGTFQRHIK